MAVKYENEVCFREREFEFRFQLQKGPHVMERDFVEKEFDFRLATKPRGFQSGK